MFFWSFELKYFNIMISVDHRTRYGSGLDASNLYANLGASDDSYGASDSYASLSDSYAPQPAYSSGNPYEGSEEYRKKK